MNVFLGSDSLTLLRSGVGRMTLEIARHLRSAPDVHSLRLVVGGRLLGPEVLDHLPLQASSRSRRSVALALKRGVAALPLAQRARQRLIRARLDREAARLAQSNGGGVVYHEPNMIVTPFGGPTVATFNDLSWFHHPETHPVERIQWITRGLPRTLRQARRFVTISEFTANGMVKELGLSRERIDVVPLAPSGAFRPVEAASAGAALARHGLRDRGYVLSVSTLEPRKNFDRLLAAWLRLPARDQAWFPLVIVGAKGWGTVLAEPAAQRAQAAGNLRLLGHVADDDLAALYARCAAFAYVSLYEGFGLPLLEAMAAGAPVIASATTACGETAGDAAILVDPTDSGEIAHAMAALLGDAGEADRLRALGLRRAAQFTWTRTAEKLQASWRRAIALA